MRKHEQKKGHVMCELYTFAEGDDRQDEIIVVRWRRVMSMRSGGRAS